MERMPELTCFCFRVEKQRIVQAIEAGCRSLDEIRERLGATGGCGGCIPDVEALLEFYARLPAQSVASQA